MSRAHCILASGYWASCGNYNSLKALLASSTTRVVLGDSHMKIAEISGFRRYQVPAARPGEVLVITKYLLRRGKIDRAVIGLAPHHMRDNSRIKMQDPLSPRSLIYQRFPFPVYFLEPDLTAGLKYYLWHALTRRPLPSLEGRLLRTDNEFAELAANNAAADDIWLKTAERTNLRWWQRQPIRYRQGQWQKMTQAERDLWTKKRFDRFYPAVNYRSGEAHRDLTELLALLQKNEVTACFVRMPHAPEWEQLTQRPQYYLYNEVQQYLESFIRQNGFHYVNTATLNLELQTKDFNNADHVNPSVMPQLTRVLLEACYNSDQVDQSASPVQSD